MNVGTFRISRLVLALETLVCFFPHTWMFGALASRGVYGFAGPLPLDAWFFTMLSVAAIGPIGLVIAFKSAVLGRPGLSRVVDRSRRVAIECRDRGGSYRDQSTVHPRARGRTH